MKIYSTATALTVVLAIGASALSACSPSPTADQSAPPPPAQPAPPTGQQAYSAGYAEGKQAAKAEARRLEHQHDREVVAATYDAPQHPRDAQGREYYYNFDRDRYAHEQDYHERVDACAQNEQQHAMTGTLVGAGVGAAVGAAVAPKKSRGLGAILGGVLGGVVGNNASKSDTQTCEPRYVR